jgi:hypothetical protein
MPQEFVLASSRYPDVTPKLRQACGTFFDSPEYRLVQGSDDLPGVVLAAFAGFLSRLLAENRVTEAEAGFQSINEMDAWGDCAVSTSIRDEFVEALGNHPAQAEAFTRLLSPQLAKCLARPV